MAKQSRPQKKTMERVMHEYKHGELKTARGRRKVKSRKQAIAIALHEAGASKYDSPKKRSRNLRRTKSKEGRGRTAMQEREGRGAMRKLDANKRSRRSTSRTGRSRKSAAAKRTRSSRTKRAKRR
jgi:hypothetical protein